MNIIRIEKRIPFGFAGDWGKVYKKFTYEDITLQGLVKRQKKTYAELGQDVQFKYCGDDVDKQQMYVQPIENRVDKGEYRVAETTDAFFDEDSGKFECVAALGDIINVFGQWWVVDSIDEKSIFTPKKQSFYFLALKRINEEVVKL